MIKSTKEDWERDKKKWLAKFYCQHFRGWGWRKAVDRDIDVNIEFSKTGKSFYHKSISELQIPILLTGSIKAEYCHHLDKIYEDLKKKNPNQDIHLFKEGKHPDKFSNKNEFFELIYGHFKKY